MFSLVEFWQVSSKTPLQELVLPFSIAIHSSTVSRRESRRNDMFPTETIRCGFVGFWNLTLDILTNMHIICLLSSDYVCQPTLNGIGSW